MHIPNGYRLGAIACPAALVTAFGIVATRGLGIDAASHGCALHTIGAAPVIPALTAPPRTAEWLVEYARAERAMFGLDSSIDAIVRAASDPESTDDQLATPLTPDESTQLASYDAYNRGVWDMTTFAKAQALPNVAGVFIDPADHKLIDIAVIAEDCTASDSLAAAFPDLATQPVGSLGTTPYTELVEEFRALNSSFAQLKQEGVLIDLASINEQTDSIDITLDEDSVSNSVAMLKAQIGSEGLTITLHGSPGQGAYARIDTHG